MQRVAARKFGNLAICGILAGLIAFTELLHANSLLTWHQPDRATTSWECTLLKENRHNAMKALLPGTQRATNVVCQSKSAT